MNDILASLIISLFGSFILTLSYYGNIGLPFLISSLLINFSLAMMFIYVWLLKNVIKQLEGNKMRGVKND